MRKDNLGDRMKSYENINRTYLPGRMPIIIRLDGCHFHTFTKGFKKPFDDMLMDAMQKTAMALCREIEGVKMAYTQSDEISLLITNNDTWETQPWFGNNLSKMVSVAASIATLAFNRAWDNLCEEYYGYHEAWGMFESGYSSAEEVIAADKLAKAYERACNTGAIFDARVFVLPADEVCNYFWWRQADAQRNSIQAYGQFYFSHKELQNKSSNDIKTKLLLEKDFDWNSLPNIKKYGVCIIKKSQSVKTTIDLNTSETISTYKNKWVVDENIPLFFENRDYINKYIKISL